MKRLITSQRSKKKVDIGNFQVPQELEKQLWFIHQNRKKINELKQLLAVMEAREEATMKVAFPLLSKLNNSAAKVQGVIFRAVRKTGTGGLRWSDYIPAMIDKVAEFNQELADILKDMKKDFETPANIKEKIDIIESKVKRLIKVSQDLSNLESRINSLYQKAIEIESLEESYAPYQRVASIKAQTNQQLTQIYHSLDTIAKSIEEAFFLAMKSKIRYEDLIPYIVDQDLDEITGMDFKKIINWQELIRKINYEINRDSSVYDMVRSHIREVFDKERLRQRNTQPLQ